MEQIENHGICVCKMFVSKAEARKNIFRLHRHTEFEISLILRGSGKYKTNYGEERISAGDIFLFSTNEQHCITDIDASEDCGFMELLNLHISPTFIGRPDNDYLTCRYIEVFFNKKKTSTAKLNGTPENHAKITGLLLEIKEEFINKKADYATRIKLLILEALIFIRRNYDITQDTAEGKIPVSIPLKFEKAVEYINRHYTNELTLDKIAETAHLSRYYFCSAFKRYMGMTVWQYINIRRTDKAIELLKNTDLTILEIATLTGFNNTANFNKIFKNNTGVTPKQIRIK